MRAGLLFARQRARADQRRLLDDERFRQEKENPQRTDHDYALCWIRREGQGRLFYEALGHHESIYYDNPQMLEHVLAGIQYALGDLKADDTPGRK